MNETAKAVVTVIGKDMVGILSKVSTACADANANVIEVTQSVLDSFFCMVMIIDITESISCRKPSKPRYPPCRFTSCTKTFSIPCTGFNKKRKGE